MNDQDQALEAQIKAAGADVAPRVTPADVEAAIVGETYTILPSGRVTVCELTLRNGFTVRGESAVVFVENFNAELGRKVARQNAVSNVWPLMGYALKERLEGLQAGDVADAKTSGFREGYASAMRGDPEPMGNGAEA